MRILMISHLASMAAAILLTALGSGHGATDARRLTNDATAFEAGR